MSLKELLLKDFVQAATPDTLGIFYAEGFWEARSERVVLANASGKVGFSDLSALLSILAGVGIRCSRIEWDGLPAFTVETRKPDEAEIAHHEMMRQFLDEANGETEQNS